MPKMIFVNLPVTDVARSTAFYEALGFEKNPAFSNEQASAMVWSDTIQVMLLDHAFYATFTDKKIIDARTTSGVLNCLSFESKADVDAIHEAARSAGGTEPRAEGGPDGGPGHRAADPECNCCSGLTPTSPRCIASMPWTAAVAP